MARVTGLEPAASGVTGRRSNQLSYTRVLMGGKYDMALDLSMVQRKESGWETRNADSSPDRSVSQTECQTWRGSRRDRHAPIYRTPLGRSAMPDQRTVMQSGERMVGDDGFEPPTLSV